MDEPLSFFHARLFAAELDGREYIQAGFRELFFVREFVQAVRYLRDGSGKKLAAHRV